MSLIADALQKTNGSPEPPSKTPRWAYGILFGAFAVLAIVLAKGQQAPATVRNGEKPVVAQAEKEPSRSGVNILRIASAQYQLNGIVRGGDGKPLAVVNNALVEEGDQIRGARVVKVTDDSVELETDNGATKTIQLN